MIKNYAGCRNEIDGLEVLESITSGVIEQVDCDEYKAQLLEDFVSAFPWSSPKVLMQAEKILNKNIVSEDEQ